MKDFVKIFVVALIFFQHAAAQNLENKISVSYSDITLKQILSDLSSRYNVYFSYSEDQVSISKKITFSADLISLQQVLDKIGTLAEVDYQLIDNQIVLRDKPGTSEKITVKGKIIDKETKYPLPFASVRVIGTGLGTASNNEGNFVFTIPRKYAKDSIIISYIGYRPYTLPVSMINRETLIELEADSKELSTVVVTAKTGLSILQEAIARIHENYDTGKVLYSYFIRDVALQDEVPIGASETIYQAYRQPSLKQIKAIEGRRIKDFSAIQHVLQTFIRLTGFELGISTDIIFTVDLSMKITDERFPGPAFLMHHQFEFLGTSLLNGKEVYVISFDQKDRYKNKSLYKGKFFIETENLAFVRIEMELSSKGIKHARFMGMSSAMAFLFGFSQCSLLEGKYATNYKYWNGKWYPSDVELVWVSRMIKEKNNFASDFVWKGHVVITDIQTDDIKPFRANEILNAADQRSWEYMYKLNVENKFNAIPTDTDTENTFRAIALKNKQHGINMNFWKRYAPYRNDRSLLIRDSLRCQQFIEEKEANNESLKLGLQKDGENKLFTPTYPSLNTSLRTKYFVLNYVSKDSAAAKEMSVLLENNYKRVLNDFGIKSLNDLIKVELYPDIKHYHFAIGNPDAPESDAGMATDDNTFKIVSPGNPGTYQTHDTLMKGALHEFAHCVHYHFIESLGNEKREKMKNTESPWLFEAMASYEAGQFYNPEKFEYLKKGQYPTLQELNEIEKNGKIYDLGYVLIDFIQTRWDKKTLFNLLGQNGDIENALGITEHEFETKFYDFLKKKFTTD